MWYVSKLCLSIHQTHACQGRLPLCPISWAGARLPLGFPRWDPGASRRHHLLDTKTHTV